MPKLKVNRTTDYQLAALIRGEISMQGVNIETAAHYAGCCPTTLYRLIDSPTAYMDKALKLMRALSIPIETVRAAISYPY